MKVTLKTQTIILMILIPVLIFVTVSMAWIIYSDLHQVILNGFDKKLFAISTVMGSFIDGDIHDEILESKQIKGMAFDPATNTLYGINAIDGYLLTLRIEDDWSSFGAAREIKPTVFLSKSDLAFDPKNRMLYGLDSTRDQLIAISPTTGYVTTIGAVGIECFGLAFDSATGVLYGSGSQLIKIDPATGKGTVIGPLGFDDVRGLAFDAKTKTLYGTDSKKNQLITINTETGTGTSVGSIIYSDEELKLTNSGLAFDPASNTLYGGMDRLIKIESSTGKVLRIGYSGYRDEKSKIYRRYYERMRQIKLERELTFLYTFVLATEEDKQTLLRKDLDFERANRWVYVLDAEELNDPEGLHSRIGDIDIDFAGEKIRDVFFKGIVYLSEIEYWQEWGFLKTGFAPIFNKEGAIRGISGADVNVNKIKEKTNLALLEVCLIGAISLLLAGLVSFYITGKLIEPIRHLKEGALKVAAGKYGHQIPVQNLKELGELSISFNNISQVLKETIEDVTQSNQSLDARRDRQELIRLLAQDADGEQFPHPDVLVHWRLGKKTHFRDSSGWACWGETSLLWLADSPEDSLQAIKLRRDIATVADSLLRRFSGDWDAISAKLENLFEDSVYCFALLEKPGSGSVRFLTRRSVAVMLIDETKKICQYDITQEESLILLPGQTLIVSSANWSAIPDSITKLEKLISTVETDANCIASILANSLIELFRGTANEERLTGGILTVMVRKR